MSRHATRHVGDFAEQLKAAMAEDGIAVEEFARRIGKPLRTVQRWRSGESVPNAKDFMLVAHALDRDANYFYPQEMA